MIGKKEKKAKDDCGDMQISMSFFYCYFYGIEFLTKAICTKKKKEGEAGKRLNEEANSPPKKKVNK